MGSTKQHYLKALLALLEDGIEPSKALSHLKSVMKKRGHTTLLLPVFKAAVRELGTHATTRKPRLILARESDEKKFAKKHKAAEVVIDETLIGGYVFEENGTRLDQSYKTKLLNWYREAISNN